MTLPIYQDQNKNLMLLQTNWSSQINPLITAPITSGHIISNVSLVTGSNTIQTGLNAPLTGWFIVRQRGLASIYDNQDNNTANKTTLVLISSANVSVDLYVF